MAKRNWKKILWPFGKETPPHQPESNLVGDRIPLNPAQLVVVNKKFPQYLGNEGSTTRQEYTMLEKLIPGFNDPHTLSRMMEKNNYSTAQHNVAAAYATIYTTVKRGRNILMSEVDKIREFYLTDVIINQMVEDALAPDVHSGEIVNVRSDNPKIQAELKYLDERFKFDSLLKNIMPDFLAYGEYTLSTVVSQAKGEAVVVDEAGINIDPDFVTAAESGLQELNDTVDQASIVAITKNNDIQYYLEMIEGKGGQYQITKHDKTKFVKFSLNHQKIRIDLNKEFNTRGHSTRKDLEQFPRFTRVGKSVIYPVLSKLKELELLEALVPASKLSKLSEGTIIGVQVPAGYEIEQGLEACEQIEGVLNRKLGVDKRTGDITVESILASTGKLKCVPIFGDKGSTTKLDTKSDEPDELLGAVSELRRTILDSIGIPFELVFSSDSGSSKGELLKRYARYLRRLKNIQRAIIDGIYQIVAIHLANKGIDWRRKDIFIEFRNTLVEIDNIDRLEFIDTVVSMLNNVKTFVNEISDPDGDSPIANQVDISKWTEFLSNQMNVVGLAGLINTKLPLSKQQRPDNVAPGNIPAPAKEIPPEDREDEED